MVLRTLRAMALGGMRDHIGGGFHRYSVDAAWRVPHFEKMLYDQAQLVLAFIEAAQVSGDPFYAEVAEDTLLYVMREMTDADGGFYSAEDADSVPPEEAGAPARTRRKARSISGAPTRSTRCSATTRRSSSCGSASSRTATRRTIRSRSSPARTCSTWRDRSTTSPSRPARTRDEIVERPATARGCDVRGAARAAAAAPRRQDPHGVERADDCRLRAHGARAPRRSATTAATPASRTSRRRAARRRSSASGCGTPSTGTLLRRYRDGHAEIDGYAEDYAYLIFGLLELFQADADPMWLEWAIALQHRQDELFWDDGERRLVQHDRPGSERAAADEGGLRRRRADGQLRVGAEPAGAVAPGATIRSGPIASSGRCGCSARGSSRWAAACR